MRLFFLLLVVATNLTGQTTPQSVRGMVVTDTLWSQSLGTRKSVVIYLPPSYASQSDRRYPVAYYLHGLGGRETDWTSHGHMDTVLDSLIAGGMQEMIIVMPDGDDGWYTTWNSLADQAACRRNTSRRESAETYCVAWRHYDDYITRDVVTFTDGKYRTIANRAHRAIAGLSMGGYGAMALSIGYPEVFSAAASHSGVISPLFAGPVPFDGHPRWAPSGAALEQGWRQYWTTIGPAFGRDTTAWAARDPGRRLAKLVAKGGAMAAPALFVDCGTEDELINESRAFRWAAEQLGVAVTYHEWPGRHDWVYWRTHVAEGLRWIADHIGS